MKAMLFAAGLGTRLRPFTEHCPKALVKIKDRTLLEIALQHLQNAGVSEVVINVHHFASQVLAFLSEKKFKNLVIHISDERDALLETGGGLRKAAHFFQHDDEPFLACNVDMVHNLDIRKMLDFHLAQKPLATLWVSKRESSRALVFDEKNVLHGWLNTAQGILKMSRQTDAVLHLFAFNGIQVLSPRIFSHLEQTSVDKFSLIDTYLACAKSQTLLAYFDENAFCLDVGKPEALLQAEKFLEKS